MKILGLPPLSPEWFERRRGCITATDVPKILGVSSWGTGFDVWARLTGKLAPEEDNGDKPWLEWGNRTEEMHREWVGRLAGVAVSCSPGLVQHPDLGWLAATPDGLYFGANDQWDPGSEPDGGWIGEELPAYEWEGSLEIKAPSPWNAEDPEESIPIAYQAQVQTQLACTGLGESIFSNLVWPKPMWTRLERDDSTIENVVGGLVDWWERYVAKDVAPEVTGQDLKTLKRMFPDHPGGALQLSDENADDVASWLKASEELKAIRKAERAALEVRNKAEARIRLAMGDRLFASHGDTIFKCATQDRAGYTVDATRFTTFRKVKEIK